MSTNAISFAAARFGSSRHPFRATLPRRVLRSLPRHEPEVELRLAAASAAAEVQPEAPAKRSRISLEDVKYFLIAYTACLLAVSAFLG